MFDSDFDSTDVQDTADMDSEVEFLDTSNIISENADDIEMNNEFVSEEIDDGFYYAIRMSEDEVARIDEMWDDNDTSTKDIEPYQAIKNSDIIETDVKEPYRATSISDSNDIVDDALVNNDVLGVESALSLEEQFAEDIESMSFDDLRVEQERLDALSQMDDLDIFEKYDISQKEQYDSELLNELTEGLPRETLEHLKNGLATGDPNTYEYFGLNGEVDEGNEEQYIRTRKK